MSASMYNSSYVYKAPHPKIHYPPIFSGVRITFKYLFDSKFLTLAVLIFLVTFVISIVCAVSPFWFKLVLSEEEGTFGKEATKRKLSINTGIIFMNEDEMDNLMDFNKNNNQEVVPGLLVFAQVLEITGICSLVACLAGTLVLAFRRFSSVTANFILAFYSSFTGVLFVLVFIAVLIMAMSSGCDPYEGGDSCVYKDNLKWRVFPIYSQFYRVESVVHPFIKLNWTFYISLLVAILTLAASGLLWIEAFKSYNHVSKIRYNQLRSVRSPYEGDINPGEHHKYVYKPPVKVAPMTYGMQPVVFQGGPYAVAPGAGHYNQGLPPPHPHQGVVFSTSGVGGGGSSVGFADDDPYEKKGRMTSSRSSPPPPRGQSPSAPPVNYNNYHDDDSGDDSPPPARFGRVGRGGGGSPPPSHGRRRSPSPPSPGGRRRRSPSPPSPGGRRRSPPPARRGGPPSLNSSVSEGPFISREIEL